MTNFAGGIGCDSRSHRRDLKHYDKLPAEVRDRLRRARSEMCSACVAAMLRRDGLEQTLAYLDHERTHRAALVRCRGRLMQVLIREPELKP